MIILYEELYKKLIKKSLEKYGKITMDRIQIEKEFHDCLTQGCLKRTISNGFYRQEVLDQIVDCAIAKLGKLTGKKILNYGCGENFTTCKKIVHLGGEIIGIDISNKRVEGINKNAMREGLIDNIKAIQMNAEKMDFEDGFFDAVFGRAILHHLNLDKAGKEIARVLKPGGRAVFIEPLGMNPLINLYRQITLKERTPFEHPLTFKDIEKMGRNFEKFEHKEFYLVALLSIIGERILKKYNPFKIKKIQKIDEFIYKWLPFLKKYSWVTIITFQK